MITRKKKMEAARISINNAIDVIIRVENRCMALDGPVGETVHEMQPEELKDICGYLHRAKTHLMESS